jgi:hypothetical protein
MDTVKQIIEYLETSELKLKSFEEIRYSIESLEAEESLKALSLEDKLEGKYFKKTEVNQLKQEIYLAHLRGLHVKVVDLVAGRPTKQDEERYLINRLIMYGIMRLIDDYERIIEIDLPPQRLKRIRWNQEIEEVRAKHTIEVKVNDNWYKKVEVGERKEEPYHGKKFFLDGKDSKISFYIRQLGGKETKNRSEADYVLRDKKVRNKKHKKNVKFITKKDFQQIVNEYLIEYVPKNLKEEIRKRNITELDESRLSTIRELLEDCGLSNEMKGYVIDRIKYLTLEAAAKRGNTYKLVNK